MAEIGEPVNVGVVSNIEHDESCYFCKDQPPGTEDNDLTDSLDEDTDLDGPASGKFKNDAGKLGTALKNGGSPQVSYSVSVKDEQYDVTTAAHHLIPGNAALKKSTLFQAEYLWKDGPAKANIGYNVNSAPNGVWSPGNYAVRPWGEKPEFQEAYAFEAMRETGTQFHDAHETYSNFVKDELNNICDKLEASEDIWCPVANKRRSKQKPEEREPLRILNGRLHTISSRMRRMLTGGGVAWKVNVWTSRFAVQFMAEEHPRLRELVRSGKLVLK